MATGRNSLMRMGDELYMVHHARPEGDEKHPFLQIRQLFFDEAGRVMVWPLTYTGEPITSSAALPERWRLVHFSRHNHGAVYAVSLSSEECHAQINGDQIELTAFGLNWRGKFACQGAFTACTLHSKDGESLWGIAEA